MALLTTVALVALLVAEVASGWHLLHSVEFFTAFAARKYVWANALAAALVAGAAIVAPGRWRWLAVAGPGALLVATLIATAIPGGQLLAMIAAALTMAALWDTGERLLRRLGASSLSRIALVAWLAGIGPWSLALTILGRFSLVRWWSIGVALVLVGAIGLVRIGARLRAGRRAVARELTVSPLHAASAGLLLLAASWSAIYTAAPEIQYDALYGKAYLPELWARTGHVSAILQHVQDSITGWFQLLATGGHLLGATAVGRYMQLLGLVFAACAVWWWGRRHGALGPIAAVAVAVTPHLLWQASTADDDLLLALCALALCIAVVESLRTEVGRRPVRGLAFALGLMAGSAPSLKLHLVPLFALLLLGWIAAGRPTHTIRSRLGFAALGAGITGLPPLILRWVDTGNPILPAYNNVFRSPYWLPINEKANFPFWPHPGALGPLAGIWKAVVEPSLMVEDAPPGAFGMLIGFTVVALLAGWAGRDRSRATRVLWAALVVAAVFWWINFRYLRYLLPVDLVSVALILMLTTGVTLGKKSRLLAIGVVTATTIASFPVTIAQFWNVPTHKPPTYAAIGRWSPASYENAAFPARTAILAFNRLAPHDARVATDAFQRVWLKPERDLYNLHYEVAPLMAIHGPVPLPTTGDQTFRDFRRLGIEWVLVTEADRLLQQPGYLSQVLTVHGQIEFSERGWDLYRLVERPPRPTPLSRCDLSRDAVMSCWGVPPTSALAVSVTRVVPVCPGETLAVSVTQRQGPPSPVLVQFAGGDPADEAQPGEAVAGSTQIVYATAPPGAGNASVTVSPTAGATITAARIGRLGRVCAFGLRPSPGARKPKST